jgi:hypothetical protein
MLSLSLSPIALQRLPGTLAETIPQESRNFLGRLETLDFRTVDGTVSYFAPSEYVKTALWLEPLMNVAACCSDLTFATTNL